MLTDSVLKDQAGRTAYVAANYQFQFDDPPQTGAIYTSGFSVCANNTLALGGSAMWYQCISGSFYNLYDRSWAPHCVPIYIYTMGGSSSAPASQMSDGQPQATPAASVTQLSDGQVSYCPSEHHVSQTENLPDETSVAEHPFPPAPSSLVKQDNTDLFTAPGHHCRFSDQRWTVSEQTLHFDVSLHYAITCSLALSRNSHAMQMALFFTPHVFFTYPDRLSHCLLMLTLKQASSTYRCPSHPNQRWTVSFTSYHPSSIYLTL